MSANLYNIESLLIGKTYRSRSVEGVIEQAEKSDVWYENATAYRVRIRPTYGIKSTYRVLAVAND